MTDRSKLEELVRLNAGRYRLDPSLLSGVVDYESGWNPGAVNRSSGATGLGQVMPREAGFPDRPSRQELLDPATNLDWSARILRSGLDRYGSEDKALAAYLGAIDARGNITGAVDANGTGGNRYIREVRARQARYPGLAPDVPGGAEPWAADLLASAGPSRGALPNDVPGGRGVEPLPQASNADEPWALDLLKSAGSGSGVAQNGRSGAPAPGDGGGPSGGSEGEVWPVAGQKWGAVNNPFGGAQSRSAGATVALPSSNVGADLTAQYGQDVVAPVSGTIVSVYDAQSEHNPNENSGWGGSTLLKGDNGFFYRLSHARPGSTATRPGQRVQQGQYLQQIGVSGNSTGPHLDAEKFDRPGHFVDLVAGGGRAVGGAIGEAVGGAAQTAGAWVQDLLRSAGGR